MLSGENTPIQVHPYLQSGDDHHDGEIHPSLTEWWYSAWWWGSPYLQGGDDQHYGEIHPTYRVVMTSMMVRFTPVETSKYSLPK